MISGHGRVPTGVVVSCLAAILCVCPGCRKTDPAASASEARVGTWKTQQTIQPFFYGQFLPAGQRVEVLPFTDSGDMKIALLAGKLDMAGCTLVTAIHSAANDQPVVIVASLCNKCSALVARKDSGIQSPADLRGRRIGYVRRAMHHVLLLEALAKAGLSERDVELVPLNFFDILPAFSHGQVDAFLSGEPSPTIARRNGTGIILSCPYYDDSIGTINAGMVVTKEAIEQRPQLVEALVRAHARATEHLKDHPEQWLDRAAEFGVESETLAEAAPNIELSWDISPQYIAQTANLAVRMKELGIIERVPDIKALFDTRFVDKVRQEMKAE